MPRLCGFYPGICLTTEEKARKNLSLGDDDDMTYLSILPSTSISLADEGVCVRACVCVCARARAGATKVLYRISFLFAVIVEEFC